MCILGISFCVWCGVGGTKLPAAGLINFTHPTGTHLVYYADNNMILIGLIKLGEHEDETTKNGPTTWQRSVSCACPTDIQHNEDDNDDNNNYYDNNSQYVPVTF